jgi:hypothetical protein
MNFTPFSAFFLFPAMIVLLELGHRSRLHRKTEPGSAAIEGAVFALFGLLLAFTFSGAVTRFDAHRELVVEESNDIGTAYLRLDLLPPQDQAPMRQLFRDYVTSRLHLYDRVSNEVSPATERMQQEIWQKAVAAVASPGANPDAGKLLLPALNAMIDITATRRNAFNMHPPAVFFLFALHPERGLRLSGRLRHDSHHAKLVLHHRPCGYGHAHRICHTRDRIPTPGPHPSDQHRRHFAPTPRVYEIAGRIFSVG